MKKRKSKKEKGMRKHFLESGKIWALFGEQTAEIIEELNEVLAALFLFHGFKLITCQYQA